MENEIYEFKLSKGKDNVVLFHLDLTMLTNIVNAIGNVIDQTFSSKKEEKPKKKT